MHRPDRKIPCDRGGDAPRPWSLSDVEQRDPTLLALGKLVVHVALRPFREPAALVMGVAFLSLMAWGFHGELQILGAVWPDWARFGEPPAARPRIVPGVPWGHELVSFVAGALLVVVVPCVIVKKRFGHDLQDYGLGLPPKGRGPFAVWSGLALFLISFPAFHFAASHPGMRAEYPLYRGFVGPAGESLGGVGTGGPDLVTFALYELSYLPFFVAIEFVFRGFLLFGLFRAQDAEARGDGARGERGPLLFGTYAVFISMLAYTAWHLGKPLPETWGTLVWGVAAGAAALAAGTIWPVVAAHWLLNVYLDFAIVYGL